MTLRHVTDTQERQSGTRTQVFLLTRTLLLLLLLAVVQGPLILEAAQPKSVEQFLGLRDNWKQFAEVGTSFHLEGRVSSWSETLLRLRNCSLNFRADTELTFPRLSSDSRSVELRGFMRMQNGRPEFVVTSIEERESDVTFVRREKLKLPVDKSEPWFEFGQWVRQRAEFYRDEALAEEATEILTDAVRLARREPQNDGTSGLRRLAQRTLDLELGKRLWSELMHESVWVERRSDTPIGLVKAEIERTFAGYDKPLEADESALRKRYLTDPLSVYSSASDLQRPKLHRILYADVCFEMIRANLKADYSNGLELADRIDRDVPEYHAEAEAYRDRALERQSRLVDTLTRTQAVALAKAYQSREQPEKAHDVLELWIKAQESKWLKDGTIGEVRLADERLELLDDKAAAIRLLQSAYLKSNGDPEVARKLKALGIVRSNGQWVNIGPDGREDQSGLPTPPRSGDLVEQRPKSGSAAIRPGMTRDEVLARLGQPDAVSRLVISGQMTELWSYGRGTQTTVRFVQRLRAASGDARVEDISTREN